MVPYDEETLLAYCLNDLDPDLREALKQQMLVDEDLRSRMLFVQEATLGIRRRKPRALQLKRRWRLLGACLATVGCLFLGMALQAHFEFLQRPSGETTPMSEPLSWDGPSEHIL